MILMPICLWKFPKPVHQIRINISSPRARVALGALSAALFFARSAFAADPPRAKASQFDLEKTKVVLSGLIDKTLKETGVPSISIALVRGDEIVWKAAFGYANVRTKTPATPETIYNAASTFKAVTATALMQLAEQGKFKLDHPVNRYLGEFPVRDRMQSEKEVTFTHILSHWSGLTTFPKRGEAAMKPIWSGELPKPLSQVIPELYSIRPPETKYEYNNYGYGLAGFLLEKISGVEYDKYISEHVLKPLGVTTPSPFHPSPEMVEMMALPYNVVGNQPRPAAQVFVDATPAGNAYLTAEDMARFLGAQVNGGGFQGQRILSEESVKQMQEPRFGGIYGFGLNVRKLASGATMIRHTGRLPGMSSITMGDVDAHVGVYYMANATDVTSEIADAAIALLRGGPYPPAERQAIKVDPTALDRYVGSYEVGSDVFDITREEGSLYVQKNKNKKAELLAETPTTFFIKGQPATVTFETNAAGEVDRMSIFEADWQLKVGKKRP
jgi:CubicO group peptidase (beta-lactamase class C family)